MLQMNIIVLVEMERRSGLNFPDRAQGGGPINLVSFDFCEWWAHPSYNLNFIILRMLAKETLLREV